MQLGKAHSAGRTRLLTHPQQSAFGQLGDAVCRQGAVMLELRVLLSLQLGDTPQNLTAAPGVVFGFLKGFNISDRFILGFTFLPLQKPCLDNARQHPCLVQTGIKVSRCLFARASRGIEPKTFNRVSLSFPSWRLPSACFEAGLRALRSPAGLQHTQPSSPVCGPPSAGSLQGCKNAPAHWTLQRPVKAALHTAVAGTSLYKQKASFGMR